MDGPALGLLRRIEVAEHEQGLRIALFGELVGDQECAVLRLDVVRSGEELLREGHSRVRLHLALERVAGDLQPLGALDVIGGVFHRRFLTRRQIRRLMLQDFGGLFLQRRVRFGQDPRIDEVSGPGKQNDREDSKDNVENKALVAFGAFLQIQQFAGRDRRAGFPIEGERRRRWAGFHFRHGQGLASCGRRGFWGKLQIGQEARIARIDDPVDAEAALPYMLGVREQHHLINGLQFEAVHNGGAYRQAQNFARGGDGVGHEMGVAGLPAVGTEAHAVGRILDHVEKRVGSRGKTGAGGQNEAVARPFGLVGFETECTAKRHVSCPA